ncbi:helix-turn-helix domain-containing protein [Iamia sp.]|uniref:helix-turn-helix domain-containing protein n=1 Tax=Iamia sp. TaxID=2722710 RepID=UPI002CB11697|nr:helix-turn-helix domain-containing protein [Iamia sp.]HXH56170.1 helix-turn-helix domain-containing protein [Iamia sp.]
MKRHQHGAASRRAPGLIATQPASQNAVRIESGVYPEGVTVVDVVEDLNALQELAEHEADPERRRTLDAVRSRLGDRDRGAKVAEAAELLGITPPTVRAWITSGVLVAVPDARPTRVDTLCLADVKRALDLIREHSDDRHLLADVHRVLRDRAALDGAEEGFADLRARRLVPLTDDLLAELSALPKGAKRSRSGST